MHLWEDRILSKMIKKHLSTLTMPSSAIIHPPVCSSPLPTLKISGLAMQKLDLERVWTKWSQLHEKILLKETSYSIFDFRFEGQTLLKFRSSHIFTLFMIFLFFLQWEILTSEPLNQQDILIFSPTQIVICKIVLPPLMLSHWNWHQY